MSGVNKRSVKWVRLRRRWQAALEDHVIALAWAPGGALLAAAAVSGPVTVFSCGGEGRHTLKGHGFGTTALAWNADGAHLASAGQDGRVRLWDLARNEERLSLECGAAWVERLAWCPYDNLLATAAGRKLRLWDPQGRLLREFADHPSTVADIQWRPRGRVLASAAYGQLCLWSPESAEPLRRLEWKGSMLVLAWSPDGRYIATGDQDATVHFWVVETGDDLMMSGYPAKVRELAWDATGRYLATGGGDGPCVWDCSGAGPADTTPIQFKGSGERLTALTFQHAGPLLASAGTDGQVFLWQPGKRKEALSRAQLSSGVTQLAWSPDDQFLAAGTEEGTVVVYSI